jgi:hypothetical protein
VAEDGTCISPPGEGEQDVFVDDHESAPPCPAVNDTPIWYAHEMPGDPELAHFRWEKGYLSKIEDLTRNFAYPDAKYYNGRDIFSEKTARYVMRPGFINVRCIRQFRIPLAGRKSVVRFKMTSNGSYDGKIESAF